MTTAQGSPRSGLGRWGAVRMVAGREIRTRATSKAFRIVTVVMLIAVVALALVIKAVQGSEHTAHVGFDRTTAALAQPFAATAKAAGSTVTTSVLPTRAAAEQQVKDGKLDAYLTVGSGENLRLVVKKSADGKLKAAAGLLARQAALDQQIRALHGDPAKVDQAVSGAGVTVTTLQKSSPYHTERLVLGTVVAVLIFMALQTFGQMVVQGVVEEKSSRVVELLLATVRPWQLMAGKVLGIGLIALVQLVLIGGVGLGVATSVGVLSLPLSSALGILGWLVVWFLLGYFIYSLLLAAAGALVSRQEDAASVTAPVTLFIVVPYVVGISVLPSDPGNTFATVLSLIPLCAPTLMPVRLAMGNVPAWQAALAVALALALIPVLVWLTGRIYRNAVLRTGSRIRLRDALRAAG